MTHKQTLAALNGNLRTFEVSAYHGENHTLHTVLRYRYSTPAESANAFAKTVGLGELFMPMRKEQPITQDGSLFSVWSVGASGIGQRIWIKENIGTAE